jgi:hypothetical protein
LIISPGVDVRMNGGLRGLSGSAGAFPGVLRPPGGAARFLLRNPLRTRKGPGSPVSGKFRRINNEKRAGRVRGDARLQMLNQEHDQDV